MYRLSRRLIPLFVFTIVATWLTGCADEYSSAVRFRVRSDPVFLEHPKNYSATSEWVHPDPPAQLPLLTVAGMYDAMNPYHPDDDNFKKKLKTGVFDPRKLSDEDKQQFFDGLRDLFGTPQFPLVSPTLDENGQSIPKLKLDATMLSRGGLLYRNHCLTCHGLTGDGRGPTAQWVNPHPRDYRAGLFKFQSVNQAKSDEPLKPLREDLYRTLYQGVEGTSMPAFNLLPHDDLEALVSYVIFLSVRGETEAKVIRDGLEQNKDGTTLIFSATKVEGGIATALSDWAKIYLDQWAKSQSKAIEDADFYDPFEAAEMSIDQARKDKADAETMATTLKEAEKQKRASVQRGYALFTGNIQQFKTAFPPKQYAEKYLSDPNTGELKADYLKDGKLNMTKVDEQIKNLLTGVRCVQCHIDFGRRAKFKLDDWGTMVRPANLTVPVYRGGRRPIDLYWRIHSGIAGSGMIPYAKQLKEEQIWDVVNFVRILPYPAMRKKYNIQID